MSGTKKTIIVEIAILVCLLILLIVSQAHAAELQKGIAAMERGDIAAGLKELQPLAEQGVAEAQTLLAKIYYHGEELLPQDYNQSIYWYTKAAEQGDINAQFNLGSMYHDGYGSGGKDYNQAIYWYTKAAEQGDALAQRTLGDMYYDSYESGGKDKAIYWYTKGAEQGNASSQFALGMMYYDGIGVPQNYIYAYAWFNLAAAKEVYIAIVRDEIAKTLSPEQLVYAQSLSAEIQHRIQDQLSDQQQSSSSNPTFSEPQMLGSGTGTVITTDGYVLTCSHVIDKADTIEVKLAGKTYQARIIHDDKYNDLALLKISGSFQALAFSSSRSAKIGQDIFTLGYPRPNVQGEGIKFTKGSISSLTGLMDDLRMYQISVPVQPGNSGGPLLDMNGNITGVIFAILSAEAALNTSGSLPQNVNYAIKSTYAKNLIDVLPEAAEKLPSPSNIKSFEEVVDMAQKSIVMILTYK